jgi:release factor glutamine methyltransferase
MDSITLRQWQVRFSESLAQIYEQSEIEALFYRLIDDLLKIPKYKILLDFDKPITESEFEILAKALQRLSMAEPLQYITGKTFFRDLELLVSPAVLIPRPETEELVGLVLQETMESPKILDIGTGSGCIAISLAKSFLGTDVCALDISTEALDIAKQNAINNKTRVRFFQYDIFNLPASFYQQNYDIIVSNPPYVTESDKSQMHKNVLLHEPSLALFVPDREALKYYTAISHIASKCLLQNGIVWVEINESLGFETAEVFRQQFLNVQIFNDFRGKERFIRAQKKR